MNCWFEVISSYPEREGKYLICPINALASTVKDYKPYKILMEPKKGDIVFHYLTYVVRKEPGAFTSYSWVEDNYYIVKNQDALCSYLPPYRKINLIDNTSFVKPITIEMLFPFQKKIKSITEESKLKRTPFDKNFQMKQTYFGRIPIGYIKIFSKISKTVFSFPY